MKAMANPLLVASDPMVNGAAALVLSICDIDTATLRESLLGSVDHVPALDGVTVTGGRLNVNSALHSCTAPPATPKGLVAVGGDSHVTLSWPAVTGALRYNIKRSLTSGGPYTVLAPDVEAAFNDYRDDVQHSLARALER